MRIFLAFALILSACGGRAETGTLGLPTPLSSPSGSPVPTPRTPPPTPSITPLAPPTASGTPTPPPPSTPSATPGAPTPRPSSIPTPGPTSNTDVVQPWIVAATATQVSLTIVYSEPMKATLPCGTSGPANGRPGTIDNQRVGEAFSHYHSADRVLDETLQSATQAAINADCTAVTFMYGLAAAAGTYTITVQSVQDQAGNIIDTTRNSAQVTIRDEDRPNVARAETFGDNIYVTFNEPMLQIGEGSGVTMNGSYRLDGTVPPITSITCNDAGCRGVRVWLRAGTIVPGRTYTLQILSVVDRAGRNIKPDPTTVVITGRDVEGRTPSPSPTRSP